MTAAEVLCQLYERGCGVRLEAGALILEPQPLDEALCELVQIHAEAISALVKEMNSSEATIGESGDSKAEAEGCADGADRADPLRAPEGHTSALEALTQRCWALSPADVSRIETEFFPQLSALDPSEVIVDAVLRVISSTTGTTRTALRKTWKQHQRKESLEQHGRSPNHAELLVNLASEVELFHTADKDAYADLRMGSDDHRETYRVQSSEFRDWLCQRFLEHHHRVPNAQALQDAVNTLWYRPFPGRKARGPRAIGSA